MCFIPPGMLSNPLKKTQEDMPFTSFILFSTALGVQDLTVNSKQIIPLKGLFKGLQESILP